MCFCFSVVHRSSVLLEALSVSPFLLTQLSLSVHTTNDCSTTTSVVSDIYGLFSDDFRSVWRGKRDTILYDVLLL